MFYAFSWPDHRRTGGARRGLTVKLAALRVWLSRTTLARSHARCDRHVTPAQELASRSGSPCGEAVIVMMKGIVRMSRQPFKARV